MLSSESVCRAALRSVRRTLIVAAAALASPVGHAQDFAAPDALGAISVLDAGAVLRARAEITTGKVYSLAIVTGAQTPAYGHRNYQMQVAPIYVGDDLEYGANRLRGNDDLLITYLGIGTQIDGFGHVSIGGRHFGDVDGGEVLRPLGVARFGIESIPPIVTRGVLLDFAALNNRERLADSTQLGPAEIDAALARQQVTIQRGDVVLLHTGWLTLAGHEPQRFLATPPGLNLAGARHLADLGVVAIGADNWALEAIPAADPAQFLPVHGELLVERGIYILENVNTADLAGDEAWTFFFMLAAPRFEGAVQSVVHPVAIR